MKKDDGGPIPLLQPKDPGLQVRVARADVARRLAGHSTARTWLPADTGFPAVDRLREQHLRLRDQLAAARMAQAALEQRIAGQDKQYGMALQAALRGGRDDVTDDRLSPEEQHAQRKAVEERVWAAALALADVCDEVVQALREHEEAWITALRVKQREAEEIRRQAQEALAQARAQEFVLQRTAAWLRAETDDVAFSRQPFPSPDVPAPDTFEPEDLRLDRHWSEARPWHNEISPETLEAIRQAGPPAPHDAADDDDLGPRDQTGRVFGLDSPTS